MMERKEVYSPVRLAVLVGTKRAMLAVVAGLVLCAVLVAGCTSGGGGGGTTAPKAKTQQSTTKAGGAEVKQKTVTKTTKY